MEPTSSMTGALATEIQRAVDLLPASHRIESQDGELVNNLGMVILVYKIEHLCKDLL